MARRKRGTGTLNVDFSGVEERTTLPEGNYLVEVESVEEKEGNKGAYLSFTFKVAEGKFKGNKLFHNCSLAPQALFNLKNLLEALGMNIPKKAFDLDPDDLVGLQCVVEVTHEVYEGKKRPRIVDFINADGGSSDSDSDVEELLEDLDADELKDLAKELGAKAKDLRKLDDEDDLIDYILENFDEDDIEEALEDDDDDDDEEQDYEEMSLKELKDEAKSRGLKVKRGMDEDDLIEMLEEDDEN